MMVYPGFSLADPGVVVHVENSIQLSEIRHESDDDVIYRWINNLKEKRMCWFFARQEM
jgi:hypothetical protein